MKTALIALVLLLLLAGQLALAQATQAQTAPAQTAPPVEDFKPSELNQPGKQYPEVNSQRRVRTILRAPTAQSVLLEPYTLKWNGIKLFEIFW